MDKWVGTKISMVSGAVLGAVLVTSLALHNSGYASVHWIIFLCLTFALFISVIHSSKSLYSCWMAFAKRLNTISITILFGACYLIIVPLFFVVALCLQWLRRRRAGDNSQWVQRTSTRIDLESLSRMG